MPIEAKVFELRDNGTRIPVLAVRTGGAGYNAREQAVFADGGFFGSAPQLVLLADLNTLEAHYEPDGWRGGRTRRTAHRHIYEHWDEVRSGEVMDVRYLAGETDAPALTDYRLTMAGMEGRDG